LIFLLKGIPSILSPELVKILMEMGHGDELVIADRNFPAASCAQRLVRCDGAGLIDILDSILTLLPLDTFVEKPVSLMAVAAGDKYDPVIWKEIDRVICKYETKGAKFEYLERADFYDRSRKAYAIVATGEAARYANVILKKGIVEEESER
jgi:L-fucose mutarotase